MEDVGEVLAAVLGEARGEHRDPLGRDLVERQVTQGRIDVTAQDVLLGVDARLLLLERDAMALDPTGTELAQGRHRGPCRLRRRRGLRLQRRRLALLAKGKSSRLSASSRARPTSSTHRGLTALAEERRCDRATGERISYRHGASELSMRTVMRHLREGDAAVLSSRALSSMSRRTRTLTADARDRELAAQRSCSRCPWASCEGASATSATVSSSDGRAEVAQVSGVVVGERVPPRAAGSTLSNGASCPESVLM